MCKVPIFHKFQESNRTHQTQNKFLILVEDQFQSNQRNKAIVFQELGSRDSQTQFNRPINEPKMAKVVIQPMNQPKPILCLILG